MGLIKLINDEQAVTVTIESILLFSITVMLLGMVMLSFQSINDQASETVMREQYGSIGNDVATKILDLDNEVKASLSQGSVVTIENELNLKSLVANKPYSIELDVGKVIVQSLGSPSVTVEVPFDTNLNVVSGSTIYSTAAEHALMYDPNGQIMFKNGGVDAYVDDQWPIIYFDSPEAMANLSGTVTINVFTLDNVEISKVEYFINENYEATVGAPFEWEWDTSGISDDTYTITAIAYDRAGHYSYDTRNFKVYNGLDLEAPTVEVVSPTDGSSTDFNPPPIEVIVRDNIAIDVNTIQIILDKDTGNEEDITANSTITNTSYTEYNILYNAPEALSEGSHSVYIYAEELYYGVGNPLNQNVSLTWDFTVTSLNDNTNPEVTLNFPLHYWDQQPGENIKVTYLISDNANADESGIDYIIINVSDGTSNYIYRENVSYYPDEIYSLISTWQFSQVYEMNKYYSYNVTAYDRVGNSNSASISDYQVIGSQSSNLIIDVIDQQTASNKKNIVIFRIMSSGSDLDINGMDVSFTTGTEFNELKFGNAKYYTSPDLPSPANMTWSPYRVPTSYTDVTLQFTDDVSTNPVVTIHFLDGTSTTETIIALP